MLTQQLLLNVIPFIAPVEEKQFAFYTKKQESFSPIHIGDLEGLLEGLVDTNTLDYGQWLYTDFADAREDAIIISVNLTEHIYFAQHYYRHLIRTYFKGVADVMRSNFTSEIEVWIHNPNTRSDKYKEYHLFTLKVQHNRLTEGPELVVSFDGKTKVYIKSLAEMVNFPPEYLNWINCNGELHRYSFMPAHYKQQLDKLFPVLSNTLKPQLNVAFDIPDFNNRYPKYHKILTDFYNRFLNTEAFRQVLPICPNGFMSAATELVQSISNTSNELRFGKSIGKEPKTDMKNHGPYMAVPPPNNVKFFFIYRKDQRQNVVKLYNYFVEGFKQEGYTYPAFPNMQNFICQPFHIEENASITFTTFADAVSTVQAAIKNKDKQPNTRYMAIYISPASKMNVSQQDKHVYYRIKEILLQHGITSQAIYADNITNPNFKYFLPNIEIAILAKLGGIPWRLNRNITNELIVGIGAFYNASKKTKYVGSAFCFNNEGIFQGFDCFQANETDMLAGSIRKAVLKYIVDNEKAERLIIHFYKEISKKELQPIISTLHKLGLPIPVIIVTINKTESKELLAFDTTSTELMPYSGTIVKIGSREYLLFNNTRYDANSKPTKKEYHFPVKISLASSDKTLLDDPALVENLIDQVYQFSRMYWKSVSQQNLPVTIKYPEMVAEIYPYFQYEKLPDFGKENLWFL